MNPRIAATRKAIWQKLTMPDTSHRGTEEIFCTGDNCGSMTESIYTDPSTFARPSDLENAVLEGFGLLPTR